MSIGAIWMSPDCMNGKHRGCNGEAWDLHDDELTDCDCDCHCQHESWTGDEGPMSELGRWPRRWKCDGCGVIKTDSVRHDSGNES